MLVFYSYETLFEIVKKSKLLNLQNRKCLNYSIAYLNSKLKKHYCLALYNFLEKKVVP